MAVDNFEEDFKSGSSKTVSREADLPRAWPFRIIRLPYFPNEPEKNLRAEILTFWIFLVLFAYAVIAISLCQRVPFQTVLEFTAIPLGCAVTALALIYIRDVRWASIVLCSGQTVALMYSSYHAGGLFAPGPFAFIVPLVAAAFTLDQAMVGLLSAVVAVYLVVLTIVQTNGLLPPPAYVQPVLNRAFTDFMITGSITSMVWWATRRIESGRKLLQAEIEERKAIAREVRVLNHELEDRVKDRTADLDAFTAMVAHDLRGPIMNMRGYAELLKENESVLDEEAKFFISRLSNSAKHMNELIDRMLEFSRRQREGLRLSSVNMKELAEAVRYELIEAGSIPPEWISIGELPDAESDLGLIRQVWINLLDNAVKYSRHREQPSIRVFAEDKEGLNWYVVEDNGMGFKPEDGESVFVEFRRVHDNQDIQGSGIGLSTVKRIVERHGGRITAQGQPDQGAKIMFHLPANSNSALGSARLETQKL